MHFDTIQEEQDYAAQVFLDDYYSAQAERQHYRERELDMFFDWYTNHLDSLIRRDPSEAYEAFHERRLAVGIPEPQFEEEKAKYFARKAQYFYQQGLTETGQIPF
jgi:hypothetical protein